MHNLHLIVTRAKDEESARNNAENLMLNWGDENNWRQVEAVVRAKDNHAVLFEKSGFYSRDRDTIAKLNKLAAGWLKPEFPVTREEAGRLAKRWLKGKVLTGHQLWELKRFFTHEAERQNRRKFDVLKDELFAFEYDQNGVTNIVANEEEGDIWVCFVDMHS